LIAVSETLVPAQPEQNADNSETAIVQHVPKLPNWPMPSTITKSLTDVVSSHSKNYSMSWRLSDTIGNPPIVFRFSLLHTGSDTKHQGSGGCHQTSARAFFVSMVG
jgi:hypothetical protein